jgi:predicted GNAT family acetyltransferase
LPKSKEDEGNVCATTEEVRYGPVQGLFLRSKKHKLHAMPASIVQFQLSLLPMTILQTDDGKKGAFYVEENDERLAEMTYVWAGTGMFIIDHTEVSDKLAGKGAGKQLVAKAVAFAREKNVKIKPLCPFAKAVFDKTPDYKDVL